MIFVGYPQKTHQQTNNQTFIVPIKASRQKERKKQDHHLSLSLSLSLTKKQL